MEIRIEKTKNPRQRPPVGDKSFGKYFTDHMFVMDYEDGKGWNSPAIVPYAPFQAEPAMMVFHYGQAVFEGLKAYKTDDGRILLFRPQKNFARLNASDERLCIPALDEEFVLKALIELIKIDADWIPTDENTALYIRPFVIATEPALGVHPSHTYKFMIILSPVGPYYAEGLNAVKIYVEDEYVRSVKGSIGFTKATANYAISLKGQEKAMQKGFTQVLWLDGVHRKYVEEVGTMNIFFKIGGKFVTPVLEGSILPGVTRDSVIQIAKSWGFEVEERKIEIGEIFKAYEDGTLEEIFGSGTAAVVSPVGELYWEGKTIVIGERKIGEYSQKLYDELTGIQYGRLEDRFGWTVEVR
ncbi:MAG: branched-chain amino acid aminotransferase [Clostridiales bacterium]|jgi:branched-chain amino acid aminotransferase|nr:branched-chain amino acid aminotransferase [Clostridiales bacterium]